MLPPLRELFIQFFNLAEGCVIWVGLFCVVARDEWLNEDSKEEIEHDLAKSNVDNGEENHCQDAKASVVLVHRLLPILTNEDDKHRYESVEKSISAI